MAEEDKQLNIDELMMHNIASTITKSCYANIVMPDIGPVQIDKYTLDNGFMSVDVINYGSTITSIKLPDNDNKQSDIVLGFDDIHGYLSAKNQYFGSIIGRVANRISEASYDYNGYKNYLSKNNGPHMLHGGTRGFDKKIWNAEIVNHSALWMTYTSPNLEEGFPGDLEVITKYVLTPDNYLLLRICASTNKVTPVNITNHSYFNLAGHETGSKGMYDHDLKICTNKYTELNQESLLPTGRVLNVKNTAYDFRKFTNFGDALKKTEFQGIDINYCFAKDTLKTIARLKHAASGRSLQLYSNQTGVQLYTSNNVENIQGKKNAIYEKHGALCLEPQGYPDAVNIKKFPPQWLHPRDIYEHIIVYKFRVEKLADSENEPEKPEKDSKGKDDDEVKSSKSSRKKGKGGGGGEGDAGGSFRSDKKMGKRKKK